MIASLIFWFSTLRCCYLALDSGETSIIWLIWCSSHSGCLRWCQARQCSSRHRCYPQIWCNGTYGCCYCMCNQSSCIMCSSLSCTFWSVCVLGQKDFLIIAVLTNFFRMALKFRLVVGMDSVYL